MGRPIGDTEYPRPEPAPPHPAIAELFKLLPKAGAQWPMKDRVTWLRAVCATLELVYPTDESLESPSVIMLKLAPLEHEPIERGHARGQG